MSEHLNVQSGDLLIAVGTMATLYLQAELEQAGVIPVEIGRAHV